jgi:hypothetical protein
MLLDGSTSLVASRSTGRLQVSNSLLDGATFTMGDPPSEAAAPMQQLILLLLSSPTPKSKVTSHAIAGARLGDHGPV